MFTKYNEIISNESLKLFSYIRNIENSFKLILEIKDLEETVDSRKKYYNEIFLKEFNQIEENLSLINDKLQYIRNFCYDDLNKISKLLKKDIDLIKNSNNVKLLLTKLKKMDLNKKEDILNCSIINENIRFFIHQVLNILSISKPLLIKRVFEKEIQKEEILKDNKFIISKLNANLFQIYKFEKELKLINTINNQNNEIEINKVFLKDIISYIDIYSDKISEYTYSGELFNINLNLDLKSNENISFLSNQNKLEEVLDVIINNASEELCNKEIELGKIFNKKIQIHIFNTNKNLFISIKDNGRGIKNINKIFEAYFTTKASSGGSGIGLTAAIRILNILKGKLKVKTNSKGSIFTIVLPIK